MVRFISNVNCRHYSNGLFSELGILKPFDMIDLMRVVIKHIDIYRRGVFTFDT